MTRRYLYLPIETKARELHGKTLLACKAAERGWQVLLGGHRQMRDNVLHYPPGAYVEISITKQKAELLARYRRHGHRTANLCEESILYNDGKDYCYRKVDPLALDAVDLMLASGTRNERHLRKYRPGSADKIAVVGNPRFDTLMPDARVVYQAAAHSIRARHGRFLLVNTNFGRVNHFNRRDDVLESLERQGMIEDAPHADFLRRLFAYKRNQMEKLKRLLAKVAAARAFDNIVVRPHPGENHDVWREWGRPLGVHVHFQGSANSWMTAAEVILHTGCTTGIEGLLLDRPVASFVPEPDQAVLNKADEVSMQIAEADEFLALASAWRGLGPDELRSRFLPQRSNLRSFVANIDLPMSVDRILDALGRLDVAEAPARFRAPGSKILNNARSRVRAELARLFGSKRFQKFPGVDRDEITLPIGQWVESGVLARAPQLARLADGAWAFS